MAGNSTFGGSVKLTGESEYKKALAQITQNLKVVSAEMKATTSAFDAGDKSEKELNQTSKEMSADLAKQKDALGTLKNTLAQMSAEYEKNKKSHEDLSKSYDAEKKKLDDIEKSLGKDSKEYKAQAKTVDDLSKELEKSSKDLDAQDKALAKVRIQTANAETQYNKTAEAVENMGKKTKESSEGFTVMKGVLANLATDAIQNAINGLQQLGQKFVDVGKQALDSYANYEQLEGGVKKLFGDEASKAVMENAEKAFATAGLSANEYMETVTSFSASLIAGLDGDTAKASEIADKAIRDMSDNANTFGTSMESVQATYQAFAKGNYTLLDNLKLGYGGTKEEMLRLVKDAGVVSDSVKSIDDVSFDQIIDSIHIMQEQMNIAETTSKEASSTIEGSTASMQSAWQNMLTGMADENADFKKLASNFMSTLITEDGKGGVLGTIIPRISTVITGISEAIQTLLPQLIDTIVPVIQENLPIIMDAIKESLFAIVDIIPEIIPIIAEIIPDIVKILIDLLPEIIDAGIDLVRALIDGITEAIPQLMKEMPKIIESIVTTLIQNLPFIVHAGLDLMVALIQGIVDAIPQLIEMLPTIIETIVNTLIIHLPALIDASIQIMVAIVNGLISALPQLIEMVPQIITTIIKTIEEKLPFIVAVGKNILRSLIDGIKSIFSNLSQTAGEIWTKIKDKLSQIPAKMKQWGKDMIQGLIDGIKEMIGKVGEAVGAVAEKIKSFLHFSRPDVGALRDYEQWMPDFVEGLADSLAKASPMLMNQVESLANGISGAMTFDGELGSGAVANAVTSESMVSAFKEALSEMKIELDDEVAGKFVEKTVARAIYT